METVFSDWKTILQDFKDSVEKDLDEIRKQKAEIQQIKHEIFTQMAQGQYIHDDHRIVLSAPEIIIGNVDSTGMLWSESGSTITIRGNAVNLEGSGEAGYVKSRATNIQQIAVDPGMDGLEDVVHLGSSVVTQARDIVIQSNDCNGCFSQLPTSLVGCGVSIHSDGQMAIDASRSVDVRGESISNMISALNEQKSGLDSDASDRLDEVTSITDDLEDILEDMDDQTGNIVDVRSNIDDLLDLHKDYSELIPSLVPAIEDCVRNISALAEVNRKISCLENEQTALNDEKDSFTDNPTGASLALTGEQISLTSVDGDGNIRTNAEAGIRIQTGRVDIETMKPDGSLIDDSYVNIHTGSVDISTVSPALTEGAENPADGDYTTDGHFCVNSKIVTFTAVDYNIADGEASETALTADSSFSVRVQDMSLNATDTEGNSTGSFSLTADKMKMTAADKDGNQTGSIDMKALDLFLSSKDKDGTATGAMTLTAKDVSLLSIDKDYKALGQVVVNGKDVHVKAMDLDDKGQDSCLTSGGNMVLVADNMYIGRTKSDSQSSTLLVSSDKTAIFGKTTAEMQQGDAKAVVQLTGGNVAISGSKAEFYGDNTINGKSDFKADVTMKKATADNIEAKTSFKSKNISDGIAVPGAPSTAKLSAKLSEDDAPTSTEIKLGIVEEEGEGDENGEGGTE
jgi:hypothetical protein